MFSEPSFEALFGRMVASKRPPRGLASTGGVNEGMSFDMTDPTVCGEPVDLTLAWPHRMSRSVDHIIPISRGGAHVPENCQIAHLSCNCRKGANLAV